MVETAGDGTRDGDEGRGVVGGVDSGVVVSAADVMNLVELVWSAVLAACAVDSAVVVACGAVESAVVVACGVDVESRTVESTVEVVCGLRAAVEVVC